MTEKIRLEIVEFSSTGTIAWQTSWIKQKLKELENLLGKGTGRQRQVEFLSETTWKGGEFKSIMKGWYVSIRNSLRMETLKRNHKNWDPGKVTKDGNKKYTDKSRKVTARIYRKKNKIQLHIRNQKTENHFLPRRKLHKEGRRWLLVVSLFEIIFNYVNINHMLNQMIAFFKKIERSEGGKNKFKYERICIPSNLLLKTWLEQPEPDMIISEDSWMMAWISEK